MCLLLLLLLLLLSHELTNIVHVKLTYDVDNRDEFIQVIHSWSSNDANVTTAARLVDASLRYLCDSGQDVGARR